MSILIYLFLQFGTFASGSFFPYPNATSGGMMSFPQNVGDSTICLNCTNFIKLDLPASWVCYSFQNDKCITEDIGDFGYSNCSDNQARLINCTYADQCRIYTYEVVPSNGTYTGTTTCTDNGNITKCVEIGSFNNAYTGTINCTKNGNITTCVEIGNFNATINCTENGNTTTCVDLSASSEININWMLLIFVISIVLIGGRF